MSKEKKPRLTYNDFVKKVIEYLDKKGKHGALFVSQYSKWLDIYYTNHGNQAFEDLTKDMTFKLQAGLVTIEELEEKRRAAAERRKRNRGGNNEHS